LGLILRSAENIAPHQVSNQGEQKNLWPGWKLIPNAQAPTQAVNPEVR